MTTRNFRCALVGRDADDARAYWGCREDKKWAVHAWTGSEARPTNERVVYVRARTRELAINVARHCTHHSWPARTQFAARLAGPRELGCVSTGEACHG